MAIIRVDDVEIEFQKQHPETSSKWCVFIKVRKGDHEKLLAMIMTDNMPFTSFTNNQGNIVTKAAASSITRICQ